jgi:hypothetical protein
MKCRSSQVHWNFVKNYNTASCIHQPGSAYQEAEGMPFPHHAIVSTRLRFCQLYLAL